MADDFDIRYDFLPEPLRAAPRLFDAWSKSQLKAEELASVPDQLLYHYTDEAALKGILTNEKLWCFEHQHQKDKKEFRYSLEIAKGVIAEISKSEDKPTRYLCDCLLDMLANNSFTDTFEFYLFSLSRHIDDPQQWREYGDAGCGFAIGFDPSLFATTQDTLNPVATDNLYVGRVLYGDVETSSRHRLVIFEATRITSDVAWKNHSLAGSFRPSDYFVTIAREIIASQLIWNCLTAKHEDFRNEREVRYIIMGVIAKFDPYRQFFKGKPYVETSLPLKKAGSVKEIVVGPLAPSGAKEAIEDLLKASGYPSSVLVRISGATL